ncbi:cytochrome c nitrite reductase small subunit [Myxococcus stipitatus]|uniref:cytochrome c nitrite reductase small subunit n=1 Tax=Myxococcus stipitatus TaxID=83455 RepID=UPI001EF39C28|nr:cytochrome c nitrite reductase small subunit [Myxococcus stipitatus]MCE9672631.1 cytochrome c nitrite reductase small subunit [Myxococcus stipitatus]
MSGVSRRVAIGAAVLAVLVGTAVGAAGYTFVYARGASYLTDDPAACANCHVMNEQYDGWVKGSHHAVAVCNDCHTPHDFFGKYLAKAINGWHHSVAFTTGDFHEPIHLGARNLGVTEAACRSCHQDIVHAIEPGLLVRVEARRPEDSGGELHPPPEEGTMSCLRCHRSVGHQELD